METSRRNFIKIAGAAGVVSGGMASALGEETPAASSQKAGKPPFVTELFLDNDLLEMTPGVSRRLHPAKKHLMNPVVRRETWWEGDFLQPYTTMYDEKEKFFKMWARTGSDHASNYFNGNAAYMTYLTSTDGVKWDRPKLGVLEFGNRRDHNVVFTSDLIAQEDAARPKTQTKFVEQVTAMRPQGKKAFFWSVVKNPKPRNPSEAFIALAIIQNHRRGAHIITSPDGIRWSCASAPFWQTPHDVMGKGDDCLMQIIYDDARQKWVVYRRIIPEFSERMIANESDRDRPLVDRYYRSYARAESDDLREWKNHKFILSMDADDPPDTELYQFSCHKIGQIYVGYMSVFHLGPQTIDVQLATSRDGIQFTRVCRGEAFIPAGTPGYYDCMAMACAQSDPVILNDTGYFYYSAVNVPHSHEGGGELGGCALATFKRDRFASLETGDSDDGLSRVVTKPLTVQHSKLFLNAATWMKGSIRVEALTRDWQPIPGFTASDVREIQGDALNHPVRWKDNADVSQLLGKEVRLKFYMVRSRIYGMTLTDEDRKPGAVENDYRYDKHGDSSPRLI